MNDRDIMKLALDALEADEHDMVPDQEGHMVFRKGAAITALNERLAQPEQEPVTFYPYPFTNGGIRIDPVTGDVGIGTPSQQPEQPAQQEPVAIYHGGCTVDCGEHGHHNIEMLKLIPVGTKLYDKPPTA